jgi:hypothetical protein
MHENVSLAVDGDDENARRWKAEGERQRLWAASSLVHSTTTRRVLCNPWVVPATRVFFLQECLKVFSGHDSTVVVCLEPRLASGRQARILYAHELSN